VEYRGKTGSYFQVIDVTKDNCDVIKHSNPSELSLLWFQEEGSQLNIDAVPYAPKKNEIFCLTDFHNVEVESLTSLKLLKWNKPFFCVINHDSEVGCKGVLFYGAQSVPTICLKEEDIETVSTVWKMLEQEMRSNDGLQEEMLQMMLKRILILSLRMYKDQSSLDKVEHQTVDIIREYNFLVEQYYKEKHSVAEYAEILHKSPKTLSNLFKKIGSKSPSQFIKERRMLEARRLLAYTDKSVSEIGYELGFLDVQSFSRFFKKFQGVSPAEFKTA